MINLGIIAEYNPLHNGHLYHFKKVKELYPNSNIITILSSEFSERGELCVFNKFMRTKHAINLGADLVLSNPIYYSMNNASIFAYSNVYFLNKCNVEKIIVGSESDNLSNFKKNYLIEKTDKFNLKLKEFLNNGYSFKLAYVKTFEYFNIFFKSNDMLNFFYYKAIQDINPNIELVSIKRINNNYSDISFNSTSIQSASAIRKENNVKDYVPDYVKDSFNDFGFRDINKLLPLIKYSLLNKKENIREQCEGIENRFNNLTNINSYEQLIEFSKTKRYSESKLNRFFINQLLNVKQDDITYTNYIRVLGFNSNGKKILNDIKENVQIYTSIKEGINKAFDLEIYCDKILDIVYNENLLKQDLKGPIVK